MNPPLQDIIKINPAIQAAIRRNTPVVALETAVVTHGLPRPKNHELACELEDIVQKAGALPATIGLINGDIVCGLNREQLIHLSESTNVRKISQRDFGAAVATHMDGGTTVAGTAIVAHAIGIKVFATGGVGGIHRNAPFDVSADLPVLARTPLVVVCAGAKAVLDLPATLEYLETMGIPVIGYQTDEFPAFYSRSSGLPVSQRVDNVETVVEIARFHFNLGIPSAILVVVPPPQEAAIPYGEIDELVKTAIDEAQAEGIHGASVTPYLLERMKVLTGGRSLKANLALLKNNARIASEIACAYSKPVPHLMAV
ncbi:MAG: pseudouridine-5'-phosphate glycosidase [Anaerolineaceae bacterium]|nr:pseudouridine-5'-phosphate glycosidase [Anaerolineaceae bacterium]MBN2677346.1 pseudouridine-5'-phosphate glycosidase [Anaerolineaceae bacterium]